MGRRPKAACKISKEVPPSGTHLEPPSACLSWRGSSDHGDIKDASNGASGGGCAHPRALVAAQARLYHGRLAVRHLAKHSMALRCGWLSRQRGAVTECTVAAQVLVAADHLELGPRLKRPNLEFVILQRWHFHRTKWQRVLQRCSRRPGLVPRWTGWRLLLSPTTTS